MPDLSEQFEANRAHLRAVAYRMLGSHSEADDVLQECWLRLMRSDSEDIANLRGWLTTVVSRVCLDALRSRKARREEGDAADAVDASASAADAEGQALMAESIGVALFVVLEALAPAERVAFVLHDLFDLPFDDIAPILDCSAEAARQLASRARRRVRRASPTASTDVASRREIVRTFLAASRSGDVSALLAVLAPDVLLRADDAAVRSSAARRAQGAPELAPEIRGAGAVADTFKSRAAAARPARIDGAPGLVFALGGQPRAVFQFVIIGGRISEIDLISEAEDIAGLEIEMEPVA